MRYEFIDKAVWIPEEKILVISDLHLGYEESLNIGIPRSQYKETLGSLDKIFKKIGRAREIVILGDLKHEFSQASSQEWGETLSLVDYLKERSEKVILIRGNHDNYLGIITRRKDVELVDYYIEKSFGFLHGDKQRAEILDKKVKIIFLGHLHPAISIRENAKHEIYKCFLRGKWKGKEIVILPSFFPLVEGQDVNMESTNLDFNFKLDNFEVFIPSDKEVLDFGKLENVGKLRY